MRSHFGIKPQDILIILKIVTMGNNKPWRQQDIAMSLDISQGEVAFALERLRISGLIDDSKKVPFRAALNEFLIYGLKYVFPAELGANSRGIPTAHSVGPLAKVIISDENQQYVWPDSNGVVRGISLSPLYESVPRAAQKDPKLHELLALVDSIRIGRTREKNLAIQELKSRLLKSPSKELRVET